jgi:hypothetical protein
VLHEFNQHLHLKGFVCRSLHCRHL